MRPVMFAFGLIFIVLGLLGWLILIGIFEGVIEGIVLGVIFGPVFFIIGLIFALVGGFTTKQKK